MILALMILNAALNLNSFPNLHPYRPTTIILTRIILSLRLQARYHLDREGRLQSLRLHQGRGDGLHALRKESFW